MREHITLTTKDGIRLAGDYYSGKSESGIILLHMMPATRASWIDVAEKLRQDGWHAVAIDFRGHGESDGGPSGYRSFTDEEHQKKIFDVEAAVDFLVSKGITRLHIMGASIGANLSLQYASEHETVHSAILLSPGLDYRGIKTDLIADSIRSDQAVLLAASEGDSYSYDSVKTLDMKIKKLPHHLTTLLMGSAHGTDMFRESPLLMEEIISWLNSMR